jgi:hypothetical protein
MQAGLIEGSLGGGRLSPGWSRVTDYEMARARCARLQGAELPKGHAQFVLVSLWRKSCLRQINL